MMDRKIAAEIVRAAEEAGWEVELREGYSGRGIYGRETAAIVCDDVATFAASVGSACQVSDDADAIVEAVKGCRQDSMGLGLVFY